jgi:nitrile hydratase accessory protein
VSATDAEAQRSTTEAVPSLARDERGPVFRESWEAQAFAIVLTLHERGIFTWPEWTASLANEIRRAQSGGDPDTSETYYHHWLAALKQDRRCEGPDHIRNAHESSLSDRYLPLSDDL